MGITIFTPTYNRAYTLEKLYNSLCNQTNKNFEWIIVDDGSTDNTKELIQNFINEKKLELGIFIRKIQENRWHITKVLSLLVKRFLLVWTQMIILQMMP